MEKIQSRFHWGWRIGIIYTSFALATIGFMIFSFTQKVDLVSQHYYADELQQDAKMVAETNVMNLSEDLDLHIDGTLLTIHLPNIPDGGMIHLYRPSESDLDKNIKIVGGTALQTYSTTYLAAGLWIAKVEWSVGQASFYAERRFTK